MGGPANGGGRRARRGGPARAHPLGWALVALGLVAAGCGGPAGAPPTSAATGTAPTPTGGGRAPAPVTITVGSRPAVVPVTLVVGQALMARPVPPRRGGTLRVEIADTSGPRVVVAQGAPASAPRAWRVVARQPGTARVVLLVRPACAPGGVCSQVVVVAETLQVTVTPAPGR